MKKTTKPGDMFNKFKMKKKNWIAGAIKKPGALKKTLGVKAGSKIPAKKLASAAKKGGKEGKRARLAETLKSFNHKSAKKSKMKKKISLSGVMNGAKSLGKAFGRNLTGKDSFTQQGASKGISSNWKSKKMKKTMCKKHKKIMCKMCAK